MVGILVLREGEELFTLFLGTGVRFGGVLSRARAVLLCGGVRGKGTCFGQRGWGKEVVGFVLAFMGVLGAWVSVLLGLLWVM